MKLIPGGDKVKSGMNFHQKGKAGKLASGAKNTGVADDGKDLSHDATNPLGPNFQNKMLGKGPKAIKH